MNTLLLEKLGLTQGEVKVYLALNKLGESSIGSIGKGSKVSKSKIYDILDRLIEKGLVGYITKNGTKYFAANNPNMLLDYVEKKEHELGMTKKEVISDILPRLVRERNSSPGKRVAEIYEGFHGIKTIREELMTQFKPNDTLLVLGAPKIRKKMNLTYVRYLPDNLVSPNWIDIFPDKVLFVILLDNPLAFVVRDRALANSFKSYFSIMWKNSSS